MDHKQKSLELAESYFSSGSNEIELELAKYASDNNLSTHEIDYIVGNVNKNIISKIYGSLPSGKVDPHFTFNTIKTASVIDINNKPLKKRASARLPQEAKKEMTKAASHQEGLTLPKMLNNPELIPNQELGFKVLGMAKEAEFSALRSLSHAKQELLRETGELRARSETLIRLGTPKEVMMAVPNSSVYEETLNKVAQYTKVASINEEFELDPNDAFVMKATKISDYIEDVKKAESEYETFKAKTSAIKAKLVELRGNGSIR